MLSRMLLNATCVHTGTIYLWDTWLWECNPSIARVADLHNSISVHCKSLMTLELNMSGNGMCGGDIGAVLAAILDSGASSERLSLDFSRHNVIKPQNCCSCHYGGVADPYHSLPFRWARMARLEHLETVMKHCYCSGLTGYL